MEQANFRFLGINLMETQSLYRTGGDTSVKASAEPSPSLGSIYSAPWRSWVHETLPIIPLLTG